MSDDWTLKLKIPALLADTLFFCSLTEHNFFYNFTMAPLGDYSVTDELYTIFLMSMSYFGYDGTWRRFFVRLTELCIFSFIISSHICSNVQAAWGSSLLLLFHSIWSKSRYGFPFFQVNINGVPSSPTTDTREKYYILVAFALSDITR